MNTAGTPTSTRRSFDLLDSEIAEALAESGVEKIMVYHSSWAYFARDYGLIEIAIENEGKEPSPRDLERLIAQAKRRISR